MADYLFFQHTKKITSQTFSISGTGNLMSLYDHMPQIIFGFTVFSNLFFCRFDDVWNMTYAGNTPRILLENCEHMKLLENINNPLGLF